MDHGDDTRRCRVQPLTASMESPAAPAIAEGELIDGRYRVLHTLGQGGMGAVYLAHDCEAGRQVAVKVLVGEHAQDPEFVERFMREGRTAGALDHPGIVPVFAVGRHKGGHYLVMAHLEGETLDKRFDRGPMSLAELVPIVRQLAQGLAYLHGQRLVHRDVKPGNVMVGGKGEVTLLDFGLVRGSKHPSITRDGFAVGTPGAMSPEQILGDAPVDARADQYALGALVFEALTGRAPFAGLTDLQLLRMHLEEPVPDPREFMPALPEAVAHAVLRAMAKEPRDRFPQVQDFAAALEAATKAPAKTRTGSWLMAVLGAAAIGFVVLALRGAPPAEPESAPEVELASSASEPAAEATRPPPLLPPLHRVRGRAPRVER